jgi:tetratricopeptide repeat protein 21B
LFHICWNRLICLLRQQGQLEDVDRYLKLAEKARPNAKHDPGLNYCKGVYHRFVNKLPDAISFFNRARKSADYGEKAVLAMVEIYLNPDNDNLWEETEGNMDGNEAVRVADKLLRELAASQEGGGGGGDAAAETSDRHYILECYSLMCTKQKPNIERAISRLVELLNRELNHIPALVAMSVALMILKQTPKAKNQLKRLSKMDFDPK